MSTNMVPGVLVTTDWVAQHATDAGVRVVEVDVDTTAYDQGHVPGAAGWNWTTDLCDTLVRDIIPIRKPHVVRDEAPARLVGAAVEKP